MKTSKLPRRIRFVGRPVRLVCMGKVEEVPADEAASRALTLSADSDLVDIYEPVGDGVYRLHTSLVGRRRHYYVRPDKALHLPTFYIPCGTDDTNL
jgi:hypothetical protein